MGHAWQRALMSGVPSSSMLLERLVASCNESIIVLMASPAPQLSVWLARPLCEYLTSKGFTYIVVGSISVLFTSHCQVLSVSKWVMATLDSASQKVGCARRLQARGDEPCN